MRVLVTGGAGFIGSNLCRHLEETGTAEHVIALDDLSTGRVANLAGTATELVMGSILDRDLVDELVRGVDAVVHLAARGSVQRSVDDPMATHRVNVNGTLSVLEGCRGSALPPLIFASSSSVYGANAVLPKHEELAPKPMSPYAASKLAAESYVLAYQRTYGLPALAFRFFNVYGPNQRADHDYAAVVPRFIDAALHREPVTIYGDGRQSRDFTYVESVVAVITDALRRRVTHPDPVNLAFGREADLLHALDLIGDLIDDVSAPAPIFLPPRKADVRASSADAAVLRALFPTAAPISLRDGLARTVTWQRQELAEAKTRPSLSVDTMRSTRALR